MNIINKDCSINNCDIGDLKIVYDDGSIGYSDFFNIRTNGLNNFKGFDCYYISNESVEISISHKGEVTFGPCYILNRIKYKISDLPKLLLSEKKVICSEKSCDCGINLKKEKSNIYNKILKIENLVLSNILDNGLDLFSLEGVSVSLSFNKNISIEFSYKGYIIIYYISLIENNKSKFFSYKNLGYDVEIKNNSNILYNINRFKYKKEVIDQMKQLLKIYSIINMILKK